MESHVDVDPSAVDAAPMTAGAGPEGIVADGIGFVGDLGAAVRGLGATQAVVSVTGKETWMIREVGVDAAAVDVPRESWAAIRLAPRTLDDGRVLWAIQGDLIAGDPCGEAFPS